jgi:FtsP/CotA-like multicopper oxidase with cupredoxin domain
MINGLSFPNTIHADGGSGFKWVTWINAHPGYDPFIVGHVDNTSVAGTPGDKILLRVINMGFETQPMHMHGFHGKIIGSDQRQWTWAQPGQPTDGAGQLGNGEERNTLTIGSGETYEWLLDFGAWQNQATSTYPADTQTRFDPASNLPVSNTLTLSPTILGPDGDPYIGGPTVSGATGIPLRGQLFPFHNHDDYKATNNGAYPGGMFTMIETVAREFYYLPAIRKQAPF